MCLLSWSGSSRKVECRRYRAETRAYTEFLSRISESVKDPTHSLQMTIERFSSASLKNHRENLLQLLGLETKYNTRQQELTRVRLEDTGNWVLSHPKFEAWKDWENSSSRVLWITGPPGSGKSMLMQADTTTVEISRLVADSRDQVTYYRMDAQDILHATKLSCCLLLL